MQMVNITVLILLVIAGLWTVMTRSLLRSAIGLAITSVVLTILIFRLNAALAGVFELSVCAGLIPVLFISTISLTHPLTKQEVAQHAKDRIRRFWYLPLLVVVVGMALTLLKIGHNVKLPQPIEISLAARSVLWNERPVDLIGQIIILLIGAFGVIILFKESDNGR
jgi:NADH-quinone oxidoreductase subunit J